MRGHEHGRSVAELFASALDCLADMIAARVVDRMQGAEPAPLTSWRAIADAVGVSEDTLKRRRDERADASPPYFASPEAAREWYRRLVAGPETPKPAKKKPRRSCSATGGPTLADLRKRRR